MLEFCPLCTEKKSNLYSTIDDKKYFKCSTCDLIFIDSKYHPTASQEKKQYDQHQNSYENKGYVAFLNQVCTPIKSYLSKKAKGLDYGCGPGPIIHKIMKEDGFQTSLYDPIYLNDPNALNQKYDFITCTEVFEHFHHPKQEISKILNLLKPGALLGIMTQLPPKDPDSFSEWWYLRDPTHVCFYNLKTIDWLSTQYSLTQISIMPGIYILKSDYK